MIRFSISVSLNGQGRIVLKKNSTIPHVEWSMYFKGGRVPEAERYVPGPVKISHFLWWYRERYSVIYNVRCSYTLKTSWKILNSIKKLNLKSGDVVNFENHDKKYLIVKNPVTGNIEAHEYTMNLD